MPQPGMILAHPTTQHILMKTKITAGILLMLATLLACKDDEKEMTSIVGKWKGTLAEVELHPFGIPLPISRDDDNFDTEIEFKSDATLIISDTPPAEGSWQIVDDKLITDIDFSTDFIALTGAYSIQELTATTLIIYLEKENETITDPDTGQSVSGDIKVTLHFERI